MSVRTTTRHSRPRISICVGTVWYQDPSIFRMIESIPKEWDILIVDGVFTGSDAKEKYSSEELRDEILTYPNTKLFNRADLEYKVRNKYHEESEDYDYCLVIDSDEWITEFDSELFSVISIDPKGVPYSNGITSPGQI